MSKAKRRFIKEKEAKKLLSEFFKKAKIPPQQLPTLKPPIELAKTSNEEIFFINKEPIFAKSNNRFFPTLASGILLSKMPKAVVNMGAVPHICSGADIMAPGIVYFDGVFDEEDIVAQEEAFGTLSSGKWAGKLESPVSGEIVEINEDIVDNPEKINANPYDSWLVKIKIEDTGELEKLLKGGTEALENWLTNEINQFETKGYQWE